ncbi:MAG TPA: hypothetical protein PLF81_11400 [Candidatus Anammoximicrobium sp.]|nr:hypothetical protein [Candidatus Anammoximicrobium sp.]
MTEKERNRRVAEKICREFEWNGRRFREGDCVALLNGNVVAVAPTPDEAIVALRAIDPDPKRGMVVEVAPPMVDVIR